MKLGVDVGTTLTKAVLFGASGEVLARHAAPTGRVRSTAGHYEVDVEGLVDATPHSSAGSLQRAPRAHVVFRHCRSSLSPASGHRSSTMPRAPS
jgi:sugar (pentulose or hexulose) kinase